MSKFGSRLAKEMTQIKENPFCAGTPPELKSTYKFCDF
jgi:hypothetical protein